MLRVDISNVWGQLALPDLLALEKEVSAAHKTLAEGTGEGNDFLGWLNLPTYEETAEMQRISQAAARIRENSEAFVVVGIVGSYLGPVSYTHLDVYKRQRDRCPTWRWITAPVRTIWPAWASSSSAGSLSLIHI